MAFGYGIQDNPVLGLDGVSCIENVVGGWARSGRVCFSTDNSSIGPRSGCSQNSALQNAISEEHIEIETIVTSLTYLP